ncbi:Uncharacterised protein [BD1-7 clade bacterium]|uniref:YHS domain-containing protein n=1 Tax=BD1-7 clade bacterium TaxID=2029982 RepID=A0A5S9QZ96_9GAMM|nr:Uncharacterised protein [BD1-7 clade bacterium]
MRLGTQVLKWMLLAIAMIAISACSTTLDKKTVFEDNGLAIKGYDPVAYFSQQKAVEGSPRYTTTYGGVIWRFSSATNQMTFMKNPQAYIPQYGGYCAYAMANGYVVSSDPQAWHIRDGKLYLNYSKGVRKTWLEDADAYIRRADKSWQEKLTADQQS